MEKLYVFILSFIIAASSFNTTSYATNSKTGSISQPITKLGISEKELLNKRGNPNRKDTERHYKWLTYLTPDYKNYELYFFENDKLKNIYVSRQNMLPKYKITKNMKKENIDKILEKFKPHKYTNKYIIDGAEYNFYYDIYGDNSVFGYRINQKNAKDIDLGPSNNLSAIYEKQLIDLTNVFRVQNGKKILLPLQKLNIVAKKHTTNMVARNYLNVIDPDGVGGDTRLYQAGLRFQNLGENITNYGNSSVDLNRFFIQSEVHRQNILSDDFENLGIGICTKGNELFCTQIYFQNLE